MMFQLSFNQKVGLGFAIIILLLTVSGLSSLWNLNDIDQSTTRVNEGAVPVVKQSNQVQIQLLKQAKLSSLAYNAPDEKQIYQYRKDFEVGAERFGRYQQELKALAAQDSVMKEEFDSVKHNYDTYLDAVNKMFEAKLALLAAENSANDEFDALMRLVEEAGSLLLEIAYYNAPAERAEDMEVVAGFANGADGKLLGVIKTLEEVKISANMQRLEGANGDLDFAYNDSRNLLVGGARIFKEIDTDGVLDKTYAQYDALHARIGIEKNIVYYKIEQLKQTEIAKQQLVEADKAVSASIAGLDKMLESADEQFNSLQSEVQGSLDFGFKTSIAMLVVLIVLAAQNFNSMRMAIRKKMIDLAKLNTIGRSLAGSQSQNSALEEVLQAMHEKIGVEQGSVYLTNQAEELEVKAYFPPKAIDPSVKPTKFQIGEGILGRVAESKKVVFIPNTARDKDFVQKEGQAARALLCVPLVDKDMLVGVINLSGDVKKVNFADSDYEFVSSVARSLVTTIKNIRMREVIEEQNRNLEHKVQERTAALRQKNNDIANMMANMHQGLFTITEGGLIHQEYAKYLETIFETDRIADRNFVDLLFRSTKLGADAVDQNITAVSAIVGEDEMMYDFNSHCLLTEMVITFDDGREKILELDWDPIVNEDDVIEKLMVTVRDVTELKALEAEAEGQKQELNMIGEILALDAAKFAEFGKSSTDFIDECREIIQSNAEKDAGAIAQLFRNMHTVKGNARTYGLSYITDVVHEVENTYDELRKNEEKEWNPTALLEELEAAEVMVNKYKSVFSDKLGRDASTASGVSIDPELISGLLQDIHGLTHDELPSPVRQVVSRTYNMLIALDSKPLDEVITDVVSSTKSLAEQLNKAEPVTKIDNGDIFIKREAHAMLNNIFMHVFRNAVDHGIEGAEERKTKGKPESGTIELVTALDDGFANFTVQDDGRGMAISKIFEMAIEKGIYEEGTPRPAASEIANLIFSSGFSTAEEITDVSGRGVGMDAVKEFLEENGGSIEIVLATGDESADFRAFSTIIRLPEKYYSIAPEFAKSA